LNCINLAAKMQQAPQVLAYDDLKEHEEDVKVNKAALQASQTSRDEFFRLTCKWQHLRELL
jgi:hypothetical protein